MYALYLNATGYAVETAEDGYEAVVKARTLVPDVIVMDLQMPGVDGWAAIRLELVFTFIASDAIRLRTKLMTSPTMGSKMGAAGAQSRPATAPPPGPNRNW